MCHSHAVSLLAQTASERVFVQHVPRGIAHSRLSSNVRRPHQRQSALSGTCARQSIVTAPLLPFHLTLNGLRDFTPASATGSHEQSLYTFPYLYKHIVDCKSMPSRPPPADVISHIVRLIVQWCGSAGIADPSAVYALGAVSDADGIKCRNVTRSLIDLIFDMTEELLCTQVPLRPWRFLLRKCLAALHG